MIEELKYLQFFSKFLNVLITILRDIEKMNAEEIVYHDINLSNPISVDFFKCIFCVVHAYNWHSNNIICSNKFLFRYCVAIVWCKRDWSRDIWSNIAVLLLYTFNFKLTFHLAHKQFLGKKFSKQFNSASIV